MQPVLLLRSENNLGRVPWSVPLHTSLAMLGSSNAIPLVRLASYDVLPLINCEPVDRTLRPGPIRIGSYRRPNVLTVLATALLATFVCIITVSLVR